MAGFKYERELTDNEVSILEHNVLDVKNWIDGAIDGKIANCKKQIIRNEIDAALENNLPLPSTATDVLAQVFSRKDYKNRAAREIEQVEVMENLNVESESVKTPV